MPCAQEKRVVPPSLGKHEQRSHLDDSLGIYEALTGFEVVPTCGYAADRINQAVRVRPRML